MTTMKGTIGVATLGCKVNDVESGSLIRGLEALGYTVSRELEPADVLLKNGHVMLFVGKTENGLYAVFEATAVGSKCRYYEYTYDEICQYQPYRMKGLVG